MPGLIRRSDIEEVRSRTNIADIVGDYVTLKSAGVGSMKGLCPFHEERSPSFHVRPQVGLYHCFGCGEGGDVYSFLQKMDHVTFQEAVERLAGRLGFELHYEDGGQASDHGNRARLLAANAAAESFFRAQLATPAAQIGRDFLGSRGFDAAAAERFGVGFAPKSFSALGDHLKAQGFTEAELTTAGLLSTGERGRTYDRFRGRLVWPIRDVTGQTVGFGARKLFDDDQGPKYLNTPETPIYHKAQVLYGLDLARRAIATGKQVVVVEGYTDVMACHLAGVPTAVATCGTSFGADHIKVIRRVLGDVDNADTRGTGRVVFTFDPDEAGQKAATRAFADEQAFTAQTFVAVGQDGLDPCDLRLQRGDEAIRQLVAKTVPMFEFMIRRVLANLDIGTAEGRAEGLRRGVPIVAGIRDEALLIEYEKQLANLTGTDVFDVRRMVQTARRGRRGPDRSGGPQRSRDSGPQRGREPEAPVVEAPPAPSITGLPADPITRSERDALVAMLQRPDAIGRDLLERALAARIQNPTLAVVRDVIASELDGMDAPDWAARLAEQAPSGFGRLVTELAVAPIPAKAEHLDTYCVDVVTALLERDLLRQKAELLGALQRAGVDGDQAAAADLNRRLADLELQRRRLRAS